MVISFLNFFSVSFSFLLHFPGIFLSCRRLSTTKKTSSLATSIHSSATPLSLHFTLCMSAISLASCNKFTQLWLFFCLPNSTVFFLKTEIVLFILFFTVCANLCACHCWPKSSIVLQFQESVTLTDSLCCLMSPNKCLHLFKCPLQDLYLLICRK